MKHDSHEHQACRHCCRAVRVDGSPCKRQRYLPGAGSEAKPATRMLPSPVVVDYGSLADAWPALQ